MADHVYSSGFYDYIDDGSRASARHVSGLLLREMTIDSLLDVGCGQGAWAAEWQAAGVTTVIGVDGDYVDRDRLAISAENFIGHDLSRPLDLGRRFDLVQSLEVAEHLTASSAGLFVETLAAHGDVILFSAAVPHQGGEHHVNEQPPEYWRQKFKALDYLAYDWLRPLLADAGHVRPWYRFNSVIYANAAGAARLSPGIRAARVPDEQGLAIGGDFRWAARRALVRLIPPSLVKSIAIAKAAAEVRLRRAAG